MRDYYNYLICEGKRIGKRLPVIAGCMIVLAVICMLLVYLANSYWYHSSRNALFQVGLVREKNETEEYSDLMDKALIMVQNTASVSSLLSFQEVEEEDGFRKMKQGELQALLVIPNHTAENIMNGKNTPVQLYLNSDTETETVSKLMKELTVCGVSLLDTAESLVYAQYDVYYQQNQLDELSKDNWELDQYNLNLAINRENTFSQKMVSEVGNLTLRERYIASGILLMFLLSGVAWCGYFNENNEMQEQLRRRGIGRVLQWNGKVFVLGLFYSIFYMTTLSIIAKKFQIMNITLALQLAFLTVLFFGCSYQIANKKESGILIIAILSIGLIYLSGGIIPTPLLPENFQQVGKYLPTSWMIQVIGGLMT